MTGSWSSSVTTAAGEMNRGWSMDGMPSGGGPPEMISSTSTRGGGNDGSPGSASADGPGWRALGATWDTATVVDARSPAASVVDGSGLDGSPPVPQAPTSS